MHANKAAYTSDPELATADNRHLSDTCVCTLYVYPPKHEGTMVTAVELTIHNVGIQCMYMAHHVQVRTCIESVSVLTLQGQSAVTASSPGHSQPFLVVRTLFKAL